jgi:DNA-binding transcriptional LysR family regulator
MKTFGDFDGLALFIRIVQAGGFASAERATGISKTTLSRRLSALEETLNVRLVRWTKKGVVLTEHGQQLYDRSRDAFLLVGSFNQSERVYGWIRQPFYGVSQDF